MLRRRRQRRTGLSLLEVILALAILGLATALLGQMMRNGVNSASVARDLTGAHLICQSVMSEIAAGIKPADAVSAVPYEEDPQWLYTVEVESAEITDLLQIRVSVSPDTEQRNPTTATLVRWIPDPNSVLVAAQQAEIAEAEAAAAGLSE